MSSRLLQSALQKPPAWPTMADPLPVPRPTISTGLPATATQGNATAQWTGAPTGNPAPPMGRPEDVTYTPGGATIRGYAGNPGGTGMAQPATGVQPFNGPMMNTQTTGFNDLRGQTITGPSGSSGGTIGAPSLGGGVSAPAAGPRIAAQDPSGTYAALQKSLASSVSPEATRLRGMGMTSLEGLSSAPDRGQLAAMSLALQREMTKPQWEQDLRQTGQMAAALGRTGSGMTTNELTDLTLAREKALGQFGQQAALDAAGQTMSDRLGIFDRTAGYGAQLGSEDRANAGFSRDIANNAFDVGSAVRGQDIGERDYASQEGWRRTGLAQDQQARADTNAWRGTDLALNQQARGDTNAWRGTDLQLQQQGRQDQQAQQAIENAKQMQLLQEQLLQGDYTRRYSTAELAGRQGYANSPYGLEFAAGQAKADEAAAANRALEEAASRAAMQRAILSSR